MRSARLGRETRKASPDSVEDPSWASLIFERRKEAEKRRARSWRKHWGSQEMQREAGPVSVWPETQATCSVSGPCTQPEGAFIATAHLPAQYAWPFAGEDNRNVTLIAALDWLCGQIELHPKRAPWWKVMSGARRLTPRPRAALAQAESRMVSIAPALALSPQRRELSLMRFWLEVGCSPGSHERDFSSG